jgi:hypothetical protein
MGPNADSPRSPLRIGIIARVVIGLIALVAGLVSDPFDVPAFAVLMAILVAFFVFSIYVIAMAFNCLIPRRCPACRWFSLLRIGSDLSILGSPFGGYRNCLHCGAVCIPGEKGGWLALSDGMAKPEGIDHPLADPIH